MRSSITAAMRCRDTKSWEPQPMPFQQRAGIQIHGANHSVQRDYHPVGEI